MEKGFVLVQCHHLSPLSLHDQMYAGWMIKHLEEDTFYQCHRSLAHPLCPAIFSQDLSNEPLRLSDQIVRARRVHGSMSFGLARP